MSVANLKPYNVLEAMKPDQKIGKYEEGNDSLDSFIRQTIGKEPVLSFPRAVDSPVQWIQLLQALDYQDLPGWPLLSPPKVQMQKCDKCAREFCSPINYRRHKRVHRRVLNIDKDFPKNRELLGLFWDKLSFDEAKEIVSLKNITLEEVPGSSVVKALTSFICKAGFHTLPQVYVRAGSALLDIVQARPSRFPVSSQELFSILDEASEKTFLCAGTALSMQKFVFDGEAAKIALEMKNVVACTCFLLEQSLVKAWVADKDAEALRCQKLLMEEEEAAHRRQAEILERKRLKKLRQQQQKVKEQETNSEEQSSDSLTIEEAEAEAEAPVLEAECQDVVEPLCDNADPNEEPLMKKRNGRWFNRRPSSYHGGVHKDQRSASHKIWTRKTKIDNVASSDINAGQVSSHELLIGSIPVTLRETKENQKSPPASEAETCSTCNSERALKLFCSKSAQAFLTQRWKEAVAAEHVRLVLSPESEPPPPSPSPPNGADDHLEEGVVSPNILRSSENMLDGAPKRKLKAKNGKSARLKYIPKQRNRD